VPTLTFVPPSLTDEWSGSSRWKPTSGAVEGGAGLVAVLAARPGAAAVRPAGLLV